MTELLDEVVFIERSMKERTVAFPRPLNVYKLVSDVVSEAEVFDQRHHTIAVEYIGFEGELSLDNPMLIVPLDAGLLRSIVSHVLSNGLKFSASGKTVHIAIERSSKAIEITVADDGIGIPEREISSIYDLFFRASNVGTAQGTGMGLTIVKRCVDAHSGTILCESRLGKGTTFRVRIPVA